MNIGNVNFESNVEYTTSLDNFEGPLDLLLFLVKEAQIEIRDIFVSKVTEQYLEYIQRAENLDMERASEYLNMAATLVELKSKSLLPQDEIIFGYDDGPIVDDIGMEQEEFFRKVEEYKLYKEASQKLKEMETTEVFHKEPDESASDIKVVYKDFTLEGLVNAFKKLLTRVGTDALKKNDSKAIPKETFTVAEKIKFIGYTLLDVEECEFTSLFGTATSVAEIITTFQALLELLKLQYLHADQESAYSEIKINLREDNREDFTHFLEGRSSNSGQIDEYN